MRHALEPFHKVPIQPVGIESFAIASARVFVRAVSHEQVVGDDQDVMGEADERTFVPSPGCQPSVASRQVYSRLLSGSFRESPLSGDWISLQDMVKGLNVGQHPLHGARRVLP